MSLVEAAPRPGLIARLADAVMNRPAPALRVEPRFEARNNALENPNISISAESLASIMSGGPTYAGPHVSEHSSMRSTAVYACTALNGGVVGGLPLHIFEKTDKGPVLRDDHRLYPFLNSAPNPDIGLTRMIWMELATVHLDLWGNHYSAIEFDGAGRVIGFVPLNPAATEPYRAQREGMGWRRRYRTRLLDGTVYDLDQDDVLHMPGLGFDGLKGLSAIRHCARQTIGAQLATDESSARILANGARNSGVVTVPAGSDLSPDAFDRLKGEFRSLYQGAHNAGEVVFLDNGMTFEGVQMPLKDAELLDTLKYRVVDIARVFGTPPFLIGETADMTAWGSGLEQILLGWLMTGLNRRLVRIEAELNLKLFAGTKLYVQFEREALHATNLAALGDYITKILAAGGTVNEARAKSGKPHIDGGDEPMISNNIRPLSMAGQISNTLVKDNAA